MINHVKPILIRGKSQHTHQSTFLKSNRFKDSYHYDFELDPIHILIIQGKDINTDRLPTDCEDRG